MATDNVEAALDAAVSAVATAIVERVQDVLSLAMGVIGSGISIVEAAVATLQALVYPVLGDVGALQSIREGLVSMREALTDIEDWTGAELDEVARDGILSTIASVSDAAGFALDPDDPFGEASITDAVNGALGTEFDSVFDTESVELGFKRIAAEKICEVLGLEGAITGDDLDKPEAWATLITALINDAIAEESAADAFLVDAICEPINVVLTEYCAVQKCHRCMGEDEEEECIKRREKAKKNREKHPRDCKRR